MVRYFAKDAVRHQRHARQVAAVRKALDILDNIDYSEIPAGRCEAIEFAADLIRKALEEK